MYVYTVIRTLNYENDRNYYASDQGHIFVVGSNTHM